MAAIDCHYNFALRIVTPYILDSKDYIDLYLHFCVQ